MTSGVSKCGSSKFEWSFGTWLLPSVLVGAGSVPVVAASRVGGADRVRRPAGPPLTRTRGRAARPGQQHSVQLRPCGSCLAIRAAPSSLQIVQLATRQAIEAERGAGGAALDLDTG